MDEIKHEREVIGNITTEENVLVAESIEEVADINSDAVNDTIIEPVLDTTTVTDVVEEKLSEPLTEDAAAEVPVLDREAEAAKAAVAASGTYHLNQIVHEFVEKNISPIAQTVAQIASSQAPRTALWTYEEVKEIWDRVTLELAARATAAFKNQEEIVSAPDAV